MSYGVVETWLWVFDLSIYAQDEDDNVNVKLVNEICVKFSFFFFFAISSGQFVYMDRWVGILKVPLRTDSSTIYRVAASLCLSSKGFAVSFFSLNTNIYMILLSRYIYVCISCLRKMIPERLYLTTHAFYELTT